jgi:hypothetical protein
MLACSRAPERRCRNGNAFSSRESALPRSKLRLAEPRTAAEARKTAKVNVASPYSHGIDRVERVVDTVDAMHKRRQIDGRQKQAADTYRDAFETLGGRVGGAMDFDKVRAGTPGAPPAPPALLAAETLRQARAVLGELDGRIVELVAGVGHSIEHVAALVLGKAKLSDRDTEHVGRRLREALSMLADRWHPVSKASKIRGHIEDGAKPVAGAAGTRSIDARVAHAAGHGVRYSERSAGEVTGATTDAPEAA